MGKTEITLEHDIEQTHKKYKYNVGDKSGPYETELLQRFENQKGIFKCSFVDKNLKHLLIM